MGAITWTAYATDDDLSSGFSVLADAAGFISVAALEMMEDEIEAELLLL
jgi:hypothetical protein